MEVCLQCLKNKSFDNRFSVKMNEIINFQAESKIVEDSITLFKWHDCRESMEKLIDPRIAIIIKYNNINNGNLLNLKLKLIFGLIKINWIAEIRDVIYGEEFTDFQIKGPFKYWLHRHSFKLSENQEYSLMRDEISFTLLGGKLVNFIFRKLVLCELKSAFKDRHEVLKNEFGEYQHSLD